MTPAIPIQSKPPEFPFLGVHTSTETQITLLCGAVLTPEQAEAISRAACDKALEYGLRVVTAVYPVTTIDNLEEIISHANENASPDPAAAG